MQCSYESVITGEMENPKASIIGYARILEVGAGFLLDALSKNLNYSAGEGKYAMRELVFDQWKSIQEAFFKRIDALVKYILQYEDIHIMGNMSRLIVEWSYRSTMIRHFYEHWSFDSLSSDAVVSNERKKAILKACKFLES